MPHSLFTEEQLTLLEGVLNKYCEISGQGKVTQKEAIVTQVTQKFVTMHHENDIEATKKLQNSVKNWLNNWSWELTDEEEYFQKTNWFTVFTSKNANQIKEETQKLTEVAPSSPGYAQYWQKAVSALSKTLSDGEQQTYVDLVVEWNTKGVPKDVQMNYLPEKPSLEIKDPLHMSKDNVESILHHWKERQENQFLRPIFAFKDTAKQSRKTTECTLSNITQAMPCNVTPAIPPHNNSPKSVAALSQQSKACEPLPNAEPMANVSTPITSSFSQTEHNHGSIDDSSSESSSDSNESENTVELWQCPNQHGATVEGQVEFLRSLSDRNEYLGLINVLHLTQVRTGSVEDALLGRLDWKYDNFHLPPEGHT
ncbi:hypothetical protein PAXRUDRAFT_14362 [Paxillus rubicundulus Ve08.2h10]|uniref:Uncharacterized protein n=1 Tax=Paxillus rubicundulus Ve08.2h10 TaxID=930991 RepID=A0A0D0DRJ3_9AGAM|nr:hypothetical protein PAXRUDRAFT_14362 [Paxillus rubicundulus Ve08.2h10]